MINKPYRSLQYVETAGTARLVQVKSWIQITRLEFWSKTLKGFFCARSSKRRIVFYVFYIRFVWCVLSRPGLAERSGRIHDTTAHVKFPVNYTVFHPCAQCSILWVFYEMAFKQLLSTSGGHSVFILKSVHSLLYGKQMVTRESHFKLENVPKLLGWGVGESYYIYFIL